MGLDIQSSAAAQTNPYIPLAEAKAWCRITTTEEDDTVAGNIDAAVQYAANYTGVDFAATPPDALVRRAMLLIVGHLQDNREASTALALSLLPLGVHNILDQYRAVQP